MVTIGRAVRSRFEILFNVFKNGCGGLFADADEIRSAYLLTEVKQPTEPKLNEVQRLIAQLGGFLGRERDGKPGAKAIRVGPKQVHVSANTLRALRAAGNADTAV